MTRLFRLCALALLCLALVPMTGKAQEPSAEERAREHWLAGLDSLVGGRYRAAARSAKELIALEGEHAQRGHWLSARAVRESANPADAVSALEAAHIENSKHAGLLAEYGYALLDVGRYDDALKVGEKLSELVADDPRAGFLKGEAVWRLGRIDQAGEQFQQAMSLARALPKPGDEDFDLAERHAAAGRAAWRISDLKFAQECFEKGREAHPRHVGSWLGLAQVFYETNKDESSRRNYAEKIIKEINPNCSQAYYWTSMALAFRWKGSEARTAIDKSLSLHKENVTARSARALYFILNDQYDHAGLDLERALAVNPRSIEALAAKALLAKSLGREPEYASILAQVQAFNAVPIEFLEIVADGLSSSLRLEEAVDLYTQALALQEKLRIKRYSLYAGLGRAQLNMGDDENGKKNLEIALNGDPLRNNLFTRNLVSLLRSYGSYRRVNFESGRYRFLVHRDESDIVLPYYQRELERTWDELSAKYLGFEPAKPLTVEAFSQHRDFEVRTVGIEGLPALGACFGKLVTLDSPSAREVGTYNWGSTLRHEMDHVFQLQMSNGQCPRWLAEGCSVYEERRCRPEWERHMEEELFQTHAAGKLPKVKEFNEWFGDGSRVMFAYYLGSIMVEFIVENYGGYGSVITMIREFSQMKTPDEVFAQALKINAEEFDRRFNEYVGQRVSRLKLLKAVQVEQFEDLQEKAEDGGATTDELVTLARAHFQRGNLEDARMWSGKALKLGADGRELHYTLGMLALSDPMLKPEQRNPRCKEHLSRAINMGLEDFYLYMKLAELALKDSDNDGAVMYLNLARRAFPTNPAPLSMLLEYYGNTGDEARAQEIAEQIALLDENNIEVRGKLLEHYIEAGQHDRVADMALQIIYVDIFSAEPHRARAKALKELEQWEDSVFEWTILKKLCGTKHYKGDDPRGDELIATVEIANTWLAAGQLEKAREAALDAKAIAPDDPRVAKLLKNLAGDETEDQYP